MFLFYLDTLTLVKPFPVSYFDKKHKNSFGVIMDDVCAGILCGTIFNLLHDIKELHLYNGKFS